LSCLVGFTHCWRLNCHPFYTRNLNLVNLDPMYWAEHTGKNWEVILK
jgi:hypothetical protein